MATPPSHPLEAYLAAQAPPLPKCEFARRVGVSASALSRVFTGRRKHPGVEACLKIVAATGGKVTLEQLLTWKPDRVAKDGRRKEWRNRRKAS